MASATDHHYHILFPLVAAVVAPEFPPTGVTVSKVTGHSAKIAWQPIDVAFRHGILQQYEVLVRETQADVIAARGNVSALGNRSSTTVTDLVPLREYAVTVRGFTDAGVSLPSDEVVFTTTETGQLMLCGPACDVGYWMKSNVLFFVEMMHAAGSSNMI